MNKLIKSFLSLALGFLFFTSVSAKPHELTGKYSIQVLGVNIGEFTVNQTNNNGIINIKAVTDVEVNLVFTYRVKFVQNTVYKQGILQSSHVETYKNGKLNSNMWMKLEKDSYLVVSDGDTSIINGSITYSGSLVYFNEPIGVNQLFKEISTEMEQIRQTSKHTYIVKNKKDREVNKYLYKDGILQYAEMQYTLATIKLNRQTIKAGND